MTDAQKRKSVEGVVGRLEQSSPSKKGEMVIEEVLSECCFASGIPPNIAGNADGTENFHH